MSRAAGSLRCLLVALVAAAGCGYRPVHGASNEAEAYGVVTVAARVTPTSAADAVAVGVRDALAEGGALRGGEGYPRVEIEVVRIDEEADAIGVVQPTPGGRHFPRARGVRIGVVGRAWLRRRAEAGPELDTGDVRVFSSLGADSSPDLGALRARDAAAEAAGREVGHRLGMRLLGHPAVSE